MMKRIVGSLLVAALATLTPLTSRADVAEASPTGKGIAGGALLGAELVLVTEAAFDVKPAWAYILGGVAGAAAGGVGGYFVEDSGDARAPMLMLAGGLALAIPTAVAVLAATHYEPPADYLQDAPPADEPLAEPPRGGVLAPSEPADVPPPPVTPPPPSDQTAPPPQTDAPGPSGSKQRPPRLRFARGVERRLSLKLPPPALLGMSDSRLALGIPNIEVRHAYTRRERLMFGVPDVTELRVPVLNVTF